ncbi:MAG: hypothetical protein ABUL71_00480 [Gemmatimonadota bacterium]
MLLIPMAGAALLTTACGSGYRRQGVVVTAEIGPGVDLYGYSMDRDGDWRIGYRSWTPVVVYELDGRYYPSNVRGARQVQVYRTRYGYVPPPRDQEWARTDRRFDRKKIPTDADYGRARPRP